MVGMNMPLKGDYCPMEFFKAHMKMCNSTRIGMVLLNS